MNCQRARVVDATTQDGLAIAPIQLAHLQMLDCSINPIQLPSHPVYRKTLQTMGILTNDCLLAGAVHEYPMDGLVANIGIVETLSCIIVIESDSILQVHLDETVDAAICAHVPEIVTITEYNPGLGGDIAPLASPLIWLPVIVCLVTLADVSAGRVETVLATVAIALLAFVDIFTCLAVSHQLVARVALAMEANQCVDALVLALVHLRTGALVHITMGTLVRLILAIDLLVADSFVRDTLAILAPELAIWTGGRLCMALLGCFVGPIGAAIILAITHVRPADALPVGASELAGRIALAEYAILVLIRAVSAIQIKVALPALMDTFSIFALELVRFARFSWRTVI